MVNLFTPLVLPTVSDCILFGEKQEKSTTTSYILLGMHNYLLRFKKMIHIYMHMRQSVCTRFSFELIKKIKKDEKKTAYAAHT